MKIGMGPSVSITQGADGLPLLCEMPLDADVDVFTLVGVLAANWPSLAMISFNRDDQPHSLWMKSADAWIHYGCLAVWPHGGAVASNGG